MAKLTEDHGQAPSLFWFETRNLFLMAERRGRLKPGEAASSMAQLRVFPILDEGTGNDRLVLALAERMACPAMTRAISRWRSGKIAAGYAGQDTRRRRGCARRRGSRHWSCVVTPGDAFAIDTLAGFLPLAARDRLAKTLTAAEIDTLTHLAKTGTEQLAAGAGIHKCASPKNHRRPRSRRVPRVC